MPSSHRASALKPPPPTSTTTGQAPHSYVSLILLSCCCAHHRRISLAVFGHVLDLDLSFHLNRKTGEVTKVVDRGTSAIQNVLSTILFQIAPQVRGAGQGLGLSHQGQVRV